MSAAAVNVDKHLMKTNCKHINTIPDELKGLNSTSVYKRCTDCSELIPVETVNTCFSDPDFGNTLKNNTHP